MTFRHRSLEENFYILEATAKGTHVLSAASIWCRFEVIDVFVRVEGKWIGDEIARCAVIATIGGVSPNRKHRKGLVDRLIEKMATLGLPVYIENIIAGPSFIEALARRGFVPIGGTVIPCMYRPLPFIPKETNGSPFTDGVRRAPVKSLS